MSLGLAIVAALAKEESTMKINAAERMVAMTLTAKLNPIRPVNVKMESPVMKVGMRM